MSSCAIRRASLLLALAVGLSLFAARASAQQPEAPEPVEEEPEERYPSALAQRPLTLRQAQLRFDSTLLLSGVYGGRPSGLFVSYSGVVSAGVLDDLEVGGELLPVGLRGEGGYGDPSLYVLGRFFSDAVFELGGQLTVRFPITGLTPGWVAQAALRARIHLLPQLRMDLGLGFAMLFTDPLFSELTIPIGMTWSPERAYFLGFLVSPIVFNDADAWDLPFALFVGAVVSGPDGPMADFRFTISASRLTNDVSNAVAAGLQITVYAYP